MKGNLVTLPSEKYTKLEARVNTIEGINQENALGLFMASMVYRRRTNSSRESWLYLGDSHSMRGANMLETSNIISLEGKFNEPLEVYIEGIDEEAKKFSDELRVLFDKEEYFTFFLEEYSGQKFIRS